MSAKIIILEGLDKGRELKISKSNFSIGRNSGNDLILMDDLTSRVHARLHLEDKGKYRIEDNKSRNGIFVNGSKVTSKVLNNDDIIELGRNKLMFKFSPGVPDAVVEEIKTPGFDISPNAENPSDRYRADQDEPTGIAFKSEVDKPVADPLSFDNLNLKMKAVCQMAKALSNADSDSSLLNATKHIILQALILESGGIFLSEEDSVNFKPCFHFPIYGEKIKNDHNLFKTLNEKFAAKAFSFITESSKLKEKDGKNRSYMVSAIRSSERLLGIIYVASNKENYVFSRDDIEILEALADLLATGLEKARLGNQSRELSMAVERFQKHLSPEIANAVQNKEKSPLENPFEAEDREVTVLFSDIVSFTPLSESLSPKEIADLLNEYFSRMVEVIIANKGTINKYIGDAIMAIFGAPLSHGNDPANALNAGLGMIRELEKFHGQIKAEKRFNIRIGINTGPVVAGIIGSHKRMEYTVIGDTVNCASRIESLAPPNRVAIGELTYEKVKKDFELKPIGQTTVKGKSKPIKVYIAKDQN